MLCACALICPRQTLLLWRISSSLQCSEPAPKARPADYEKIKRIGEGTFGIVCERTRVLSLLIGPACTPARPAPGWRQPPAPPVQKDPGAGKAGALLAAGLDNSLALSNRCRQSLLTGAAHSIAADKARDKRSGEMVALKKLRMERERDGKLEPRVWMPRMHAVLHGTRVAAKQLCIGWGWHGRTCVYNVVQQAQSRSSALHSSCLRAAG